MLESLLKSVGLSEQTKKVVQLGLIDDLFDFLNQQEHLHKQIYPPKDLIFRAFQMVPFNEYKVVILGQDPYHSPGQANGLAFSVNKGHKIPPSLLNIYKELHTDVGMEIPTHGDLSSWAKQGVLLLNSVLTVEESTPGAHQNKGWEKFTDQVIISLNKELSGLVFLLWGNYAKTKKRFIDPQKHLVLEANHPSPLSAYRGFFNCKHFSKTNQYLLSKNNKAINWPIPSNTE